MVEPIGVASLTWTPPSRNNDGSELTNLAGYRIVYGTKSTELTRSIDIRNASASSYDVTRLAAGTYFFAIYAYNTTGAESRASNTVSKVVR